MNTTTAPKIKNASKLLSDIARKLPTSVRVTLACIEVAFYVNGEGEPRVTTDLATALGYLANDTYWNENGDWCDADRADVRVM